MDSQFNTLSRSYHDNYIEYATTGNKTYKTAYESAEQGLQSILDKIKVEVNSNSQNIKDTLGSNAKELYHNKQAGLQSIGAEIRKQKDRVEEAKMRLPPAPPPFSHTTQYIVIASLLGAIVLLQVV